MRQSHFFALKSDLIKLLDQIEAFGEIKYTQIGTWLEPMVLSFPSWSHLPDLGKAKHRSAIACTSYLLTLPDAQIDPVAFRLADGGKKFSIDLRSAEDAMTFSPGGIFDNETLLNGKIANGAPGDMSRVYSHFMRVLKRDFGKKDSFWVGKEAQEFWNSGGRLTMAKDSPAAYDLQHE
jgi:hypothetical protein